LETNDGLAQPILEIRPSENNRDEEDRIITSGIRQPWKKRKEISKTDTVSYHINWKKMNREICDWPCDWKFQNDKVLLFYYHYYYFLISIDLKACLAVIIAELRRRRTAPNWKELEWPANFMPGKLLFVLLLVICTPS
jgi:hypothetical protein